MADKIANLIYLENMNLKDENEIIWIKCFFLEFVKKWSKIDFLRLDKYIMLTGTIVRKFLNYNLQTHNLENILKIFGIINSTIRSGFYNFCFVSAILKLLSSFVEDIFKNNGELETKKKFLQCYFIEFFEKLIEIFVSLKDNRENKVFEEYIFYKISDFLNTESLEIIILPELKDIFLKKVLDFAKSKDEYPENKRKILYKIYKKMKYNKDEEPEKTFKVDPVNQYILNRNYTNKLKMSRLERMRLIAERKNNKERVEKLLKEKSLETLKLATSNAEEAEVLKENIINIAEESSLEDRKEEKSQLSNEEELQSQSDSDLIEEDEHPEEDEFEEDDEEEEEFDFEDEDELFDDELGEEEELDNRTLYTYNKDEEMDPRMLYFFIDCDEEELKDLSEEDRKIVEAYRNSQKNTMILKPKKKTKKNKEETSILGEIENVTGLVEPISKASKGAPVQANNELANKEVKVTPNKSEVILNANSNSKRKNSTNSTGSNNMSLKRKKRVSFKIHSNQFNQYDQSKPINLTSSRKAHEISKGVSPLKGSIRLKNKNKIPK